MSWHDVWYDITDFFTTSYAEQQRNTYSNLVNKLQDGIRQINSQVETVQEELARIHRCYRNNGGINNGHFADEFNKKEQIHEQETTRLLQKLSNASNDLNGKLSLAKQKRDYWQTIVEKEDREKREYTPNRR